MLGVGLGEPPDVDFGDFGDAADARARARRSSTRRSTWSPAWSATAGSSYDGSHHTGGRDHAAASPSSGHASLIWVAGVAPNRRPLERARRWDGYVPIGRGLAPDELAAYVGEHPRPDWDLVVPWADGVPADEYADAGVTWLVQLRRWPRRTSWVEELERAAATDPRARRTPSRGSRPTIDAVDFSSGYAEGSARLVNAELTGPGRPWWRSCPAASGCTRRSPSAT